MFLIFSGTALLCVLFYISVLYVAQEFTRVLTGIVYFKSFPDLFPTTPGSAIRFGSSKNLMGFIRSAVINTINRHLDEGCGVGWCSVSWVFDSVDQPM